MLRRLDAWVLRCLVAGFDHFACLDAAHFDTTDSLLALESILAALMISLVAQILPLRCC
jgi:hypothetical protein